ncbi:MAG TPA: DUF5615 family PIN-like protein [Candidatus Obscuribacterales bacterium]
MRLKLLLDEDSQERILVAKLKKAGHDVVTAKEADLLARLDSEVLAYAVDNGRIVLTRNCEDFCNEAASFKEKGQAHHGILLRYEKNDPKKDMSYDDIIKAIAKIEKAVARGDLVLANHEISLSYYR